MRIPEFVTNSVRRVALAGVMGVGLLIILMIADRWSAGQHALEFAKTQASPTSPPVAPGSKAIHELEIPKEVSIFGERVPMEIWEVRERFEREFYSNYNNA